MACKPFIKWAGGKRQLLDQLVKHMPENYNRYFEPFIGGGALYWHLCPKNAYISDVNAELINTYNVIKYNPHYLMADLHKHCEGQEYYTSARNIDRSDEFLDWSVIERASRFIYINKTCFNGQWRVNSKNQVNSGYGYRENVSLFDRELIHQCSNQLQNTNIVCASYDWILSEVKEGDFVYFDPPYYSPSKNMLYTNTRADVDFHSKLKDLCHELTNKGAHWMLSNSAHDEIIQTFSDFNVDIVDVRYNIAASANSRGKVNEIIVTNYPVVNSL